jgi:hypothetical protein
MVMTIRNVPDVIRLGNTKEKKKYKTRLVHRLGELISLKDLREHAGGWQARCFSQLVGELYRSINVPMGGGKSLMACYLVAHELTEGQYERAIFAVPQDVIGSGFLRPAGNGAGIRFKLSKNTVVWGVGHNLIDDSDQVTNDIINFLKHDRNQATLSDRVLVCTHAALVRAFSVLTKKHQQRLLKGAHIFIDEAHHIQNSESDIGLELKNQLGELTSYMYEIGSGVTMMTATPYRGDGGGLLSPEQWAMTKSFYLPWDEYFDSLDIENLRVDYVLFDGLHYKAVESLRKRGDLTKDNRAIVYIPKTGQAFSAGTKTDDVESIAGVLWKRWRMLDLVHTEGRDERKSQLAQDPTLDVNYIMAMNMMREGANWKPADTLIIVGPRHSLTDMVQTIGRLLRDHPGKREVRVFHLLPFTFDRKKEKKYREDLNNYLKAVFCSAMVIEDVFCPVKLRFTRKKKNDKKQTVTKTLTKLREVFPDLSEQTDFRASVEFEVISQPIDEMNKKNLRALLLEVVTEELKTRGKPTVHAKAIADQLWYQFARATMRARGVDVRKINLKLLDSVKNPFEFMLQYTSGPVGQSTFAELRKAVSRGITMEDCHALAKERGGECLGPVDPKALGSLGRFWWQCGKGHRWVASYNSIQQGHWCPTCNKNKKHDLAFCQSIATEYKGKCLSVKYFNARTPMLWECEHGHRFEKPLGSITERKQWCVQCSSRPRGSLALAESLAKNNGGKCLATEWVNKKTSIPWRCSKGHEFRTSTQNVQSGKWCGKCSAKRARAVRAPEERDRICAEGKAIAEARKGKCLGIYSIYSKGSPNHLHWECSKFHEWHAPLSRVKNKGAWCPVCAGKLNSSNIIRR